MGSEIKLMLSEEEEVILENMFEHALVFSKGSAYYSVMDLYEKVMEAMKEAREPTGSDYEYNRRGYRNRKEYLEYLSAEYGATLASIEQLADRLGPHEDFGRLVEILDETGISELEDVMG